MEAAARTLGLTLEILEIKDPSGWDEVFAAAAAKRVDALYPIEYSAFTSNGKRIADAALKHRIPTVFGNKDIVAAGGLLSYGTSITARWRRTAELVDMVLKGAKPADLPVEQTAKFDLVILRPPVDRGGMGAWAPV